MPPAVRLGGILVCAPDDRGWVDAGGQMALSGQAGWPESMWTMGRRK